MRAGSRRPEARRVHALVIEVPGWEHCRMRVEADIANRGWIPALSPADADLLVVCGVPGRELEAVRDQVWGQLPGPRAQADIIFAEAVSGALDNAAERLTDAAWQVHDARNRDTKVASAAHGHSPESPPREETVATSMPMSMAGPTAVRMPLPEDGPHAGMDMTGDAHKGMDMSGHDHDGMDMSGHEGKDMSGPEGKDTTGHDHTGTDMSGHDHAGMDMSGHDHTDMDMSGHDGMDMTGHAGMDMSGHSHMGMGMDMVMDMPSPGGIPLASGGDDRDGLEMDELNVPFGPVLSHWPAGLVLRCVLHGDVIVTAKVQLLGAGAKLPADIEPDGPSSSRGARTQAIRLCDDVFTMLSLAGWPSGASAAFRVRNELLRGGALPDSLIALTQLRRRVSRSLLLRWSLSGIRTAGSLTVDAHDHDAHDHDAHVSDPQDSDAGDIRHRLIEWLTEAEGICRSGVVSTTGHEQHEQSLRLSGIPGLVQGMDVASARLAIAGLGLHTAALAEVEVVAHG